MNLLRGVVSFLSLGLLVATCGFDGAFATKTQVNSTSQKKAGDLSLQPFVFQSRSGEKVDAELGRLAVPENRKDPNAKLITLVFVRFKSTSSNPGPPIIYLAGGPGGSGIAAARGTRFPLFMAMREAADVIALDQRATGNSTPDLDCPQTLDYPLDRAGDREEILRLLKQKSRECAEHWKSKGVDLAGYNTNESADDIESLRMALGVEKVSLWAISYGTHLALATIRRHEKSIHQAVLAGVEGPSHTLKLPSNIQANLEKINLLVKADSSLNKQIPDLIAMMKAVLERLEKQPIQLETVDPQTKQKVRVTVGRFDVERLTASVIGNEQVAQIPAFYHALYTGNTSSPILSITSARVLAERRGQIGSAMPFAMDCASGVSKARRQRILSEARGTLLGNSIDFPFPEVCEGWGVPDLGESFRSPVKSNVPALFISGTLDARTPVSNAEEVRRGFSKSLHLIIDGAVHSDPLFLSSPRIKDVMLEFLKEKPISTTRVTIGPMKFAPLSQ
ncbi:MAG TPA: alpha/beta hydrolase [Blastocatellia bacterium]|jgi:pimeloyl-ACP methyl ester carboxylesterase